MSLSQYTFGPTTIANIESSDNLRQLLDGAGLQDRPVIIKPNWVSTEPGDFTDADTLRLLLEALGSPAVVTESYMLSRSMNLQSRGLAFTAAGKEVDWKWLQKGDGWTWLTEHPDWQWFRDGEHWRQIIAEDKAFLDKYGFTDLFNEFDVTYINVTEEVWQGRIADPSEVKRIVESKYRPVQNEQLYTMVPVELFKLRPSTFISFARMKMYASFTLKNLFGMIPDPLRPYWHGPNHSTIAQSIVDINKIYHALFNVFGICEAIYTLPVVHPRGQYEGIYSGKYNVHGGSGFVAFGRNLVALDALLLHLSDPSIRSIAGINRGPIELAADELGLPIDEGLLEEASAKVGAWVSPPEFSFDTVSLPT